MRSGRLLVEAEEMLDRVGIQRAFLRRRGLFHPHRRQVQELVDERRGRRLDGAQLALRQPPRQSRELALANLLGQGAQRGNRGDDVQRRLPDAEPLRLLGDDRLGPLRLAAAAGEGLRDDRFQVVDVMSLAEWTATSIDPASSASSISFTKTPRAPISPNGFVRSLSPAVVIGTIAIS